MFGEEPQLGRSRPLYGLPGATDQPHSPQDLAFEVFRRLQLPALLRFKQPLCLLFCPDEVCKGMVGFIELRKEGKLIVNAGKPHLSAYRVYVLARRDFPPNVLAGGGYASTVDILPRGVARNIHCTLAHARRLRIHDVLPGPFMRTELPAPRS
jgi:hypothetical protein